MKNLSTTKLGLVDLYDFDIKFVFIQDYMKKLSFFVHL
jgi:hypothetical protein